MKKNIIIVILIVAMQSIHAASAKDSKALATKKTAAVSVAASAATSSAASAASTLSSQAALAKESFDNTYNLVKDIARSHFKYAQNVADFRLNEGTDKQCRTAVIVLVLNGLFFTGKAVEEF